MRKSNKGCILLFGQQIKKVPPKHDSLMTLTVIYMESSISRISNSGLWNIHIRFKRQNYGDKICDWVAISNHNISDNFLSITQLILIVLWPQCATTTWCNCLQLEYQCTHNHWCGMELGHTQQMRSLISFKKPSVTEYISHFSTVPQVWTHLATPQSDH